MVSKNNFCNTLKIKIVNSLFILVLGLAHLGTAPIVQAFNFDMSGTLQNASGSIEILKASASIPNLSDNTSSTSFDVLKFMTAGDIAIVIGLFITNMLLAFIIFQKNV